MLSKTRCPIGSKNAVFNLLIKGGPAPEKCYARVWPGHRVIGWFHNVDSVKIINTLSDILVLKTQQ